TSERYPDLVEFRYVDRSNNEVAEPVICSMTSIDTWWGAEEDEGNQCSTSKHEGGWKIELPSSPATDQGTYITVVAIWYPNNAIPEAALSGPVDRSAFTASWLFRIKLI